MANRGSRKRRKPVITRRPVARGRLERRIVIPSNPERPLQANQRDLLIGEALKPETPWFTLHRKGIRRINVGEDPLEARAVPKSSVRGTLPERIVYKALTSIFRMSPNIDFTFQSSLQGGRMELGGIVADFILPLRMLVFRIQGPTHTQIIRIRKDEEQRLALEDMGYRVVDFELDVVFDEFRLEQFMRKLFNMDANQTSGTGMGFVGEMEEGDLWNRVLMSVNELGAMLGV